MAILNEEKKQRFGSIINLLLFVVSVGIFDIILSCVIIVPCIVDRVFVLYLTLIVFSDNFTIVKTDYCDQDN